MALSNTQFSNFNHITHLLISKNETNLYLLYFILRFNLSLYIDI